MVQQLRMLLRGTLQGMLQQGLAHVLASPHLASNSGLHSLSIPFSWILTCACPVRNDDSAFLSFGSGKTCPGSFQAPDAAPSNHNNVTAAAPEE